MTTSCAPDAVHPIEETLAAAIESSLDAEHGKLIRDDPQVPAGTVGVSAIAATRQQLARGHLLVPLAERTAIVGSDGHRFELEI
jgi:hypothetical protein